MEFVFLYLATANSFREVEAIRHIAQPSRKLNFLRRLAGHALKGAVFKYVIPQEKKSILGFEYVCSLLTEIVIYDHLENLNP